jgi:ArsR family transcriptional regulator, virulence genes transcriptional regulator
MDETTANIFELHAQFCKVFSNPVRLQVMWEVAERERPVTELAEAIGVSVQNLSQHLRLMRSLGVVNVRRDGQFLYYRAASPHFHAGCSMIREGIRDVIRAQQGLGAGLLAEEESPPPPTGEE